MKNPIEKVAGVVEQKLLENPSTIKSPGKIFKFINRFPLFFYQIGLGGLIVGPFLRITTIGRVSGRPRHTMLEFIDDSADGNPIILSGWGGRSDWVKNLRKNPRIMVSKGWRSFPALAQEIPLEEAADLLEDYFRKMPGMGQIMAKRAGVVLDGSREKLLELADKHPSFRLIKQNPDNQL